MKLFITLIFTYIASINLSNQQLPGLNANLTNTTDITTSMPLIPPTSMPLMPTIPVYSTSMLSSASFIAPTISDNMSMSTNSTNSSMSSSMPIKVTTQPMSNTPTNSAKKHNIAYLLLMMALLFKN